MDTVTINIVSRWDSKKVLFSANVDVAISEGLRLRAALEIAVKAGANLAGANLAGASLAGANLAGASLAGAYLAGAYLAGADLAGAYLAGAYLDGAYLAGADLAGAYLAGAYLDGASLAGAYLDDRSTLTGERPIFMLGPIGSKSRTFVAYITQQGLRLRAGCFFGTREAFLGRLDKTHGDNIHAQEYMAALAMIDSHYEIWAPKDVAEDAA